MEPICQSCGMPLSRDPSGGGTNADGTTSPDYCSHCYQGGTWMLPDLSVDEMQKRVGGLLKSKGAPEALQRKLVATIPGLKRWAKR